MIIEFVKSNKGGNRPMLLIHGLTFRQENIIKQIQSGDVWNLICESIEPAVTQKVRT